MPVTVRTSDHDVPLVLLWICRLVAVCASFSNSAFTRVSDTRDILGLPGAAGVL